MKQRVVETITQGDVSFGQVSHPDDLMKAQQFAHDRISTVLNDFINRQRAAEIVGFAYELDADNGMSITVKRSGRVTTKNGVTYDLLADTELAFASAADNTLPRIDVVIAKLDDAIDAETDLLPFVQLRTPDEFSDGVPPYPPTNISAPRERHWRAVPQIKTGTTGPTPSAAALASNEIPLYIVTVAAGASRIREADIIDVRDVIRDLRQINGLVAQGQIDVSTLNSRITRLEILKNQPIDLTQVFGEIKTLGQILAELQKAAVAARDLPEIRYDRLKGVPLSDPASATIVATGNTDGGTPCVDIPLGARVNFGDSEVSILPPNFVDQSVNPRLVKIAGGSAHVKRSVNLTLENCTQTDADGTIDFLQRAETFTVERGRPAAAARNGEFIEIFGGLGPDNEARLGDWYTYDVLNDTLTARSLGSPVPESDRPALFPFGDGVHLLLVTAGSTTSTPKWWKVNASTMAVTEITSTKPSGVQFYGDLIQAGKIFIVALKVAGDEGYEPHFWEYDTGANTFTELAVTGSVPTPTLDYSHGCYYEPGKFVMVSFTPATTSSGRTYVFDRASLQWTQLVNMVQPYGGPSSRQDPLVRFRMANVNGRPLLIGGLLTKDTDATKGKVWELAKQVNPILGIDLPATRGWVPWDATFPPIQDCGFAATIGGTGRPDGQAFMFAGQGKYSNALQRIYSSVQGGLIAIEYNEQPGVSIAEGSSFVKFEIDPYVADWEVAGYMAMFTGMFDKSTMKAEVSLNDGADWHEITAAKTLEVTDSNTPGVRRMRITFFQSKSKPPMLTRLDELLDQDGADLEDRTVVRYDANVDDPQALYVDRNGNVSLSTTITPSTPEKAIIHKASPDGGPTDPPEVRNYINRRRAHFKFSDVYSGSVGGPHYLNDMAAPVRYINAWGSKAADGAMIQLEDPTIDFDSLIAIDPSLVLEAGDKWYLEVEV